MTKRCDNCISYKKYDKLPAFCQHENHKGMLVSDFTVCPDHEPVEILTTPFDGVKLYLVNACTGEIGIKYICEDCGKEMKVPYSWQFKFPARYNNQPTLGTCGFHFRCEECTKEMDTR